MPLGGEDTCPNLSKHLSKCTRSFLVNHRILGFLRWTYDGSSLIHKNYQSSSSSSIFFPLNILFFTSSLSLTFFHFDIQQHSSIHIELILQQLFCLILQLIFVWKRNNNDHWYCMIDIVVNFRWKGKILGKCWTCEERWNRTVDHWWWTLVQVVWRNWKGKAGGRRKPGGWMSNRIPIRRGNWWWSQPTFGCLAAGSASSSIW